MKKTNNTQANVNANAEKKAPKMYTNRASIMGNIVSIRESSDPKLPHLVKIAVHGGYKGDDGKWIDKTTFVSVKKWGKLPHDENGKTLIETGDLVRVAGAMGAYNGEIKEKDGKKTRDFSDYITVGRQGGIHLVLKKNQRSITNKKGEEIPASKILSQGRNSFGVKGNVVADPVIDEKTGYTTVKVAATFRNEKGEDSTHFQRCVCFFGKGKTAETVRSLGKGDFVNLWGYIGGDTSSYEKDGVTIYNNVHDLVIRGARMLRDKSEVKAAPAKKAAKKATKKAIKA